MDKSLILKLRLVLKLTRSKVCSDLDIEENVLNLIEFEDLAIPHYLIKYYSNIISVKTKYLNMLFKKNNNFIFKIVINGVNSYLDLILTLRTDGDKK